MARKTVLTPEIQTAIVNAVAVGVSPSCAGQLVGISHATISSWMQRGAGLHPTLPSTPLYVAFFAAITRARAQDEARRISRLEQAGRGGATIYRKTITHRDGTETVEERYAPPDWQADAWVLERSRSEAWGRKDRVDMRMTIEETARQVAEELGIPVEELLTEAQRRLTQVPHANRVA